MKNIHKVVQQYGWKLEVSYYAYEGGYFVYLTPHKRSTNDFTGLTHLESNLTNEARLMYHFIQHEGGWLPIVYAETLEAGIAQLNQKLEGQISQEWLDRVKQAYEDILVLFQSKKDLQ